MRLGLGCVWSTLGLSAPFAFAVRCLRLGSPLAFGALCVCGVLPTLASRCSWGLDQTSVVEACLERAKVVVVRMGAGNLEVPDEHLRALGLRTIWVSIG